MLQRPFNRLCDGKFEEKKRLTLFNNTRSHKNCLAVCVLLSVCISMRALVCVMLLVDACVTSVQRAVRVPSLCLCGSGHAYNISYVYIN